MHRTLARGHGHGSCSDFQDPTKGIRNGMEPSLKQNKTVFWAISGGHVWETVLIGLLCFGSLGVATLLCRSPHQFQPLPGCFKILLWSLSHTQDRSKGHGYLHNWCPNHTASGATPRTWHSYQVGLPRGRFIHRNHENESFVPVSFSPSSLTPQEEECFRKGRELKKTTKTKKSK